jgi:hypothetical protein
MLIVMGALTVFVSRAVPGQNDQPEDAIVTARVLDADSGQAIDAVRVLAGTPFGRVTGPDDPGPASWQPHTIREFSRGQFDWGSKRAYQVQRLRIEAEGYIPVVTEWIHKSAGPRQVTVRMQRDPGVSGRVLTPGGDPAEDATLVLTMPNRGARLEAGRIAGAGDPPPEKLSDRWRRPVMVQTDRDGRFKLPTEVGAVMVYAVHESGIAELPFEMLRESPEVRLEGWGAIDGEARWHDRPGAGQTLSIIVVREVEGYPESLSTFQQVTTDEQGRFRAEKLPPWQVQLARVFPLGEGPNAGSFHFPYLHVKLDAGRPTRVVFGGEGRPVIGRLTGLDSWDGVTLAIAPNAPRPGDEHGWRGHSLVRESDIGPLFFRDRLTVAADGTFRIDGVLPASYQLFVSSEDRSVYTVHSFRIEPMPGGRSDEPQDLGEFKIERRPAK